MENLLYPLLYLSYSQIWKSSVLRATVEGNIHVLAKSLCLGSTKRFKETRYVYSGMNMALYPNK